MVCHGTTTYYEVSGKRSYEVVKIRLKYDLNTKTYLFPTVSESHTLSNTCKYFVIRVFEISHISNT